MMKIVLQIIMLTAPTVFALFLIKGNYGNHWIRFKQFMLYFILINASTFCISYFRGVKELSFHDMIYSYCIKWLAVGMACAMCYSIGVKHFRKYLH